MTENNPQSETPVNLDPSPEKDNKSKCHLGNRIFNIIILVAIVVLYFLFFYPGMNSKKSTYANPPEHSIGATTSNVIAFVDTDEIMEKYELVIEMKEQLGDKMERMEGEIKSKQNAYEIDATYFQEQVAKKSISEESAQLIYEKLMEEQQSLIDLRDRYTEQLAAEEYEMNVVLVDSITNFLHRYNQYHNYDYVLGYSVGGGILLAKDTFNITGQVLDAMNEEYLNKLQK